MSTTETETSRDLPSRADALRLYREMLRIRERIYNLYAERTGKSYDQIVKDCDRNKWLDDQEMIEYGLVDQVLEQMPSK